MRLRLLKVIVQPVFVIDDGENLVERPADPVVVPAAEWPEYSTGAFAASFEQLRRHVEGESIAMDRPAGSRQGDDDDENGVAPPI